jgi:Uma2 family endonuclease
MVTMTGPDLWLSQDYPITVDDLRDMPEDPFRYEIDDGMLIVSPAPTRPHQLVTSRLTVILTRAAPDDVTVVVGIGVKINPLQYREPDIAAVRASSIYGHHDGEPPLLAVEVASPRTRLYDRNRKKDVYEAFGIPSYWIVEPDRDKPRLIVFELRDGKYEQVADVTGDEEFHATQPFPVTIRPSVLVRTGPLE